MGQAVNTKNTHGLVLGPYPDPRAELLGRACPVCGEKTLTIDYLRSHCGYPRLLCCHCGAWGSNWSDEYSAIAGRHRGETTLVEQVWASLQNYTRRVADELIKDP